MDKQKLALALTKALGYTENGGQPDLANPKAGKTGETKSIFQFEPATWKAYSKQVFGTDNVPMNQDTETHVALTKVSKWVDQLSQEGDDQDTITKKVASMWNAGAGEPDAYTGQFSDGSSSKGVNKKYGVNYDVPGYAGKVEKYTNQFLNDSNKGNVAESTPVTSGSVQQNQIQGSSSPINSIMALMQQAKSNPKAQQKSGSTGLLGSLAPQTS